MRQHVIDRDGKLAMGAKPLCLRDLCEGKKIIIWSLPWQPMRTVGGGVVDEWNDQYESFLCAMALATTNSKVWTNEALPYFEDGDD